MKKKKSVIRWLYGYRYEGTKSDYVYFNYKKKKSIAFYGWERKHFKEFFGIDVKPGENIRVVINIEKSKTGRIQ